jgi:aminopeptidase N
MLWGSLWDLVRDARLDPARYRDAALAALRTERDEQIASRLLGRVVRTMETYASPGQRWNALPTVEAQLLEGASDSTRSYGLRRSYFESYIAVVGTKEGLERLNAWLDSVSAAGLPLRQPTRWSIVTALMQKKWPTTESRLAAEARRDTTTGGKRRAFITGAAFPWDVIKKAYFDRYLRDTTLNEEWVTASLGAFNTPDQEKLTLPFLRPALDTLSWVQKNRRIFFLGSWLGNFIGGQRSPEALAEVDKFIADHAKNANYAELPRDLLQKVLQARDDLERTVRIRAAFAR